MEKSGALRGQILVGRGARTGSKIRTGKRRLDEVGRTRSRQVGKVRQPEDRDKKERKKAHVSALECKTIQGIRGGGERSEQREEEN